jgi:hypothetical protein
MDNLDVIRATPKVASTTIDDIDPIGHELSEEHLYLVAGGRLPHEGATSAGSTTNIGGAGATDENPD